MNQRDLQNKYFFGLGTIGRDMFYAFESNTIIFFLTHVLSLPQWVFLTVTMALSVLRIFDAVNDTVTGLVIDNIRSPWGKFKPAIVVGGVSSVIFYLLLFGNIGTGWGFIIVFCLAYLLWDITYGINDIGYWTLLPAMTTDQKVRESSGAFSRICASVGMYIVMVAWEPVTKALGNTTQSWFWIAVVISVFYLGFQCFTVFGVKENREFRDNGEKTTLRDMWRALSGNDQLMWTALALTLFMVGYTATVGFAVDYMKYVFGNVDLYVVLVGVCGVSQLGTLTAYPYIAKRFNRRQLYTIATALVVAGYLVFFIAEISIILIALGAVLVFVGQALIQMLMLMFLADSVEYGQWKLGKRNESVTFSMQPFVNKIGGAISTAIVSLTLVLSGIKVGDTSAESIGMEGQLILKIAMFVIPLMFIVAGYIIYLKKFKIDEEFYAKILKELKEREKSEV